MADWTRFVRERLDLSDLEAGRQADIIDDVATQLEERYEAALAAGRLEDEARQLAEAEISDWGSLADSIHRERGRSGAMVADRRMESAEAYLRNRGGGGAAIADALHSLRLSSRRLRRAPGFSLVVLVTLAVAIGANTAIFSVINGILLKPLPFDEAQDLVSVWATAPGMDQDILPQSPAVHVTYEEESQHLESVGIWFENEVTILTAAGPDRVEASSMTSGVLRALRIDARHGRRFLPDEDFTGTASTVMLGHSYWMSRHGGDPNVVGQTLTVNGVDREIIGVLPGDLHVFDIEPALLLPFEMERASLFVGNFSFRSLGRLRPGSSIEQTQADLSRLMRLSLDRFPGPLTVEQFEQAGAAALVSPLRDDVIGDIGDTLWLLFGGVAVILLIACANVANIFLVRAESRERELAVRAALGAGGRQISGEFLMESLLLGLAGGVIGTWLAVAGLRLLVAIAPADLPRLNEIGVDGTVLLFAVLVSRWSGVLFGLFPMLRYRHLNPMGALKEGGRGAGAGKERHRTRNTLVVAQMAMALVLLIGSGLLIRSFQNLRQVDPGFAEPGEVLVFGISIPEAEVPELDAVARQHEAIAQRLEQVMGVQDIGLTTSVPMDGRGGFDPIWAEDFPLPEGQMPPLRRFKWIGPGYFETIGVPVLAGRDYTWDDVRNRSELTIVSSAVAVEFWGDPNAAVGKRIRTVTGDTWREIIGVVGDVRDDGLSQPVVPTVYWPMVSVNLYGAEASAMLDLSLFVPRRLEYAIRSDRIDTSGFMNEVRAAVGSVNPSLPLANPRSLEVDVRASMARTSFTLVMLAIAAGMALLLGAVGVYGVISYVVSQRSREIGVRVVLGADSGMVRRMVLGQGLRLVVVGVFVGLVASVVVTRLMAGLLYGVSPVDPMTYAVVAVVLALVALLASYLPARRAARVDPMVAIRAE
ncbi:MAG: ABC transporter permease [Gemmatimonadota bacterium]|nr:ABC transporter permease [Gemmatimonadota bacterium]